MMGAASLPQPQGSTPAGFAAFLNTIGQTPTAGGEDGGFDQLLAAIPIADAAAPKAVPVAPTAPTAAAATATIFVQVVVAGEVVAPDATAEVQVTNAKDGGPATDPDAVAAAAAKLLIEGNGSTARPELKASKAVEAGTQPDGEPAAQTGTAAAKPADVAAAIVATVEAATTTTDPHPVAPLPVAALPVAAAVVTSMVSKPVKAGDGGKLPAGSTAPTIEAVATAPTADKPRSPNAEPAAPAIEAAIATPTASKTRPAPLPGSGFTGAEPVVAKPADAAPSMTIQFVQPLTTGTALAAQITAPVTVTERVLDLAGDGAWIDQLAHDIAATTSDSGDISFRLMPRHLGRLDVAMLMGDEGVSLKLDTQHEAAATIVTAAQGRLVDDLRQQGVRVAGSEVTCTPGDGGRQMQGQSQGQGRAAPHDVSHLIETVTERAKARDPEEAGNRRGRFA